MRSLLRLVVFAATTFAQAQNEVQPENWEADQCDCFLTDGVEPEYYTEHAFWDFRSLSDYAGVPDIIAGENSSAEADFTSKYFKKKEWKDFWGIQSWSNRRSNGLAYGARFPMVNSPNNIYIQPNDDKNPASDTYLTMRTNRLRTFQGASEFDSLDHFQYLSIRFLGRTRGEPGACMAMFTYVPADEIKNIQEADLEMLTREDTDRIHYTNHPGYSIEGEVFPKATRNTTLPDDLHWGDWVEHRLDWTPTQSIWYANGIETANIAFQVPRDPSLMIFNTWGDGGVWVGNMTLNGEAYMQIQWIEMVYNISETESDSKRKRHLDRRSSLSLRDFGPQGKLQRHKRDSPENECRMVCSIDEGGGAGAVTWLWGNSTAPRVFVGESFGGAVIFLTAWVIGLTAFLWYV
ncbi:hypothetical protein G7Z17_g423 [Cylindrodendrum hubeiense]|uniref:GH16 domain-containing protein n=1 Tax=Cylindrodendrum hubeiense TaxID=595255 RepID=A0A9P5HGX1_9HYPO|nr:hypothetical protein G7Z17_g423 [Cylindrodendrum hubeiense]